MKIILMLISLVLLFSGCEKENLEEEIKDENINMSFKIPEDYYIDDNPIKVGLYDGFNLAHDSSVSLGNLKEVNTYSVYFTNKEHLDSEWTKYNYKKYYNEYKEDISKYKVGFYISFYVGDKKLEQVALDPTSKHKLDPYLYIYLYDDVNQPDGSWYSHLEPEDIKSNTVISSAKLFLAGRGEEITSPITFQVFTYDGDEDFDENGYYKGKSKYEITINLKN